MRCEGYMLVTRDIRASQRFYETVLEARVVLDTGNHVAFEEGFSLLLENDWRCFAGLEAAPLFFAHHAGQLVFEVDDLARFLEKLATLPGIRYVHRAREHPWGRWAVRLYDPDGHVVEVGESMKLVVKRFLRQGCSVEEASRKSEFPQAFVLMCRAELEAEERERKADAAS